MAALRAGRSALAIAWPSADMGDRADKQSDVKLGFALLPGSRQAYRFATKSWEDRPAGRKPARAPAGGRRALGAAVTTSTSDPQRAREFFVLWRWPGRR